MYLLDDDDDNNSNNNHHCSRRQVFSPFCSQKLPFRRHQSLCDAVLYSMLTIEDTSSVRSYLMELAVELPPRCHQCLYRFFQYRG